MNKRELMAYKSVTGYNLSQLEKDYFQNLILEFIYRSESKLYFKGGTALQKVYGIKRFSEDLDFNYVDDFNPLQCVKNVIEYLNKLGFKAGLKDEYSNKFGESYYIFIEGFLFDGNSISLCKISFDFRYGDVYLEPLRKKVEPVYDDLPDYLLLALGLDEIASEKVRAICTRDKARDIYDLYKLIKKNVAFNMDLVNKKLKTYDIVFDKFIFESKIKEKERIYESEMRILTKVYPSFNECFELIMGWFEVNFK